MSLTSENTHFGVPVKTLFDHLRASIPFVWNDSEFIQRTHAVPYLSTLREKNPVLSTPDEYFRLALSAHWASVAGFSPTDVDIHIRQKLWALQVPQESKNKMALTVLESHTWKTHFVSVREVTSPHTHWTLTGHQGEWFSVAIPVYSTVAKLDSNISDTLIAQLEDTLFQSAKIVENFAKAGDGIGILRCAPLIAHNLGDLDRMIESWKLREEDPIYQRYFKLGHQKRAGIFKNLFFAGQINKKLTSHENHRHFALRIPRALRKSPDLLLGIGPFFDDWGRIIARHPVLTEGDLASIVEALADGFEKLSSEKPYPIGYARAIRGISESIPGGPSTLKAILPAKVHRKIQSGPIAQAMSVSQNVFEASLAQQALKAWSLLEKES